MSRTTRFILAALWAWAWIGAPVFSLMSLLIVGADQPLGFGHLVFAYVLGHGTCSVMMITLNARRGLKAKAEFARMILENPSMFRDPLQAVTWM